MLTLRIFLIIEFVIIEIKYLVLFTGIYKKDISFFPRSNRAVKVYFLVKNLLTI